MFRKLPKPRTFDYRPRYFDPESSFLRDHLSSRSTTEDEPLTDMKNRVSRHFRSGSTTGSYRSETRRQIRRSNLLLVAVLGLLLLGVYWFLTVHLPRIIAIID